MLFHVCLWCAPAAHYLQPKINGPMSLLTHLERDPLFEIFFFFLFFIYYVVGAIACIV